MPSSSCTMEGYCDDALVGKNPQQCTRLEQQLGHRHKGWLNDAHKCYIQLASMEHESDDDVERKTPRRYGAVRYKGPAKRGSNRNGGSPSSSQLLS